MRLQKKNIFSTQKNWILISTQNLRKSIIQLSDRLESLTVNRAVQMLSNYCFSFCLQLTAEGPSIYLRCSCSRHFVYLLLRCTFGLNLSADLGPVLALLD